MINSLVKQDMPLRDEVINAWFEELSLPVAPSCNMMCNFCSRDSDCICNGNNPEYLSKVMTPRQAVNWAIATANRNSRIKVLKISGPGEPLFNTQTFEVLRRLNEVLPDYIYSISTNGLMLEEKFEELLKLNVKMITVSLNAVVPDTYLKLYSRIIKNNGIIVNSARMAEIIYNSTIRGIRKCIENGIRAKVNIVYFPGINDKELMSIASKCKEMGVKSLCIISGCSKGKFTGLRMPNLLEIITLKEELSKIIGKVELRSYNLPNTV